MLRARFALFIFLSVVLWQYLEKNLVLFYGECPFMYYIIIMYILVVIVYFIFLLLLYYSICVGNLVLAKSEHGENGRL